MLTETVAVSDFTVSEGKKTGINGINGAIDFVKVVVIQILHKILQFHGSESDF